MDQIETTKLNRSLTEVLSRIASGDSFEVTRYGKVVAILSPPPEQPKSKTGSFEVSDTPPHPGIKVIPNAAQQRQARADALLNAMKGKK